jgi:GT2 family glycosyltransferase/glycosyltransferase involved in cell wall biosynthesis
MSAATIRGHVDGLEGAYLAGWAVNESGAPCNITIRDGRKRVLAEGVASIERPDLLSVGQGRCGIAFRIQLPSLAMAKALHVWADGVEISQAPIMLGHGLFDGFVSVGAAHAEGWVAERAPDFAAPLITAVDQYGTVVMRCQSRREEDPADPYFAPATFSGAFEDGCFGKGELLLSFLANGVKFAEGTCNLPLHGYLETVSALGCSGWLLSPAAPDRAFVIEIWRDGKNVAKTKTDIVRTDVQSAYPACRKSGFSVALPPDPFKRSGFATISLRFPGTESELLQGPHGVGDQAVLVKAAQRMSGLALGRAPVDLDAPERAVLQAALGDFIRRVRGNPILVFDRQPLGEAVRPAGTRLNVIIPIYKGADVTRACIRSVLACLSPDDRIVLIDDCSPDADMPAALGEFADAGNIVLVRNDTNLGFVATVNRGLGLCGEGDVLLLNSDTRLFPGCLDELWNVAHSSPDIGTVTALSNNATIFSYPHFETRHEKLDDISWAELAAIALASNRGKCVDVPTGHGFCLLIKRDVLHRVGQLDEAFGRGYGEENDLCCRAADFGYRHVAASGVLVEHRDGVSFGADKADLLARNMKLLQDRFPEYAATIGESERRDDLRAARWALDAARLERASARGESFALVVCHKLGGGTNRAIADMEKAVGYGGAQKIALICRSDGVLELTCNEPAIHAVFAEDESASLVELLSAARISLVIVHQALGFSSETLQTLGAWVKGQHAIFYAHDFYPLCPRVTMIDAVGRFCNLAAPDVCSRCIAAGGAHDAARLVGIPANEHREFFIGFLESFRHVVAPSHNAAGYYRQAFPDLAVEVVPHPSGELAFPAQPRAGTDDEIVLFGAIGPHKGSAELLAIANLAKLTHPHLSFRVIGYTDIDEALLDIGNVTITGKYRQHELPDLVGQARGRLALFLQGWPETFSYTLTEAVQLGFIPLVPNIGAPAERVAGAGLGVVFDYPFAPTTVLALIDDIAGGRRKLGKRNVAPSAFAPDPRSIERTAALWR